MINFSQPSILCGIPSVARYLSFDLGPDADAAAIGDSILSLEIGEGMVVGLGEPLVALLGGRIDGLRTFPALSGPGVQVPSTQHALWIWLHGNDRGELVKRGIRITEDLGAGFELVQITDGFKHGNEELGRDLTGYEDGTENPTGNDAIEASFVQGAGPGLDGSSFVAVQKWVHDLGRFNAMPQTEQDHIIGRRRSDNEEIEDAPESAHVKRTEQESFEPAAIVLRRSMPFADPDAEGLLFVAFGRTLDAFEMQLQRMAGIEDGITDGLFRFSYPVSGAYFWCPPVRQGRLDLDAI